MKSCEYIGFPGLGSFAYVAIVFASALSGCSAQQIYNTGQAWQRNQCNEQMVNENDFESCISKTNKPYSDYKRQTEDNK